VAFFKAAASLQAPPAPPASSTEDGDDVSAVLIFVEAWHIYVSIEHKEAKQTRKSVISYLLDK
jgi:hypothetical protein